MERYALRINTDKTKVMVFTRSSAVDRGVEYQMNDHNLECVNKFIYLGIEFVRKLSFNSHANQVSPKSVRMANAAARLSRYIGDRSLNIKLFGIYNAPIVQYASVVWVRGKMSTTKLLEEGHKRATRCALSPQDLICQDT